MADPITNQFFMTPVQGEIDLGTALNNVLSMGVSSSQPTALVAGQAVKLEDSVGPFPKVLGITANSDQIWGFVVRNIKDQQSAAGSTVEVAIKDTVMYMTASAAIARGARVEYDFATKTVKTAGGIVQSIGYAYDKAAANGDMIRVYLSSPATGNVAVDTSAPITVTLAQINAGLTLIPGVAGKQLLITSFIERVTGTFATNTSVNLQSDVTNVIVEATAVAGLTAGAVLVPGSANVTLGAGYGTLLPLGEGLKVANVGAAATGGTSITYAITYDVI